MGIVLHVDVFLMFLCVGVSPTSSCSHHLDPLRQSPVMFFIAEGIPHSIVSSAHVPSVSFGLQKIFTVFSQLSWSYHFCRLQTSYFVESVGLSCVSFDLDYVYLTGISQSSAIFLLHPVRCHNFKCPITDDVHVHHLIEVGVYKLLYCIKLLFSPL